MKSPAYIAAKYIESASSLVLGVSLFVGNEPATPDECVTMYDTGGSDAIDNMDYLTDSIQWQPSIQIRVRGKDYGETWDRLRMTRACALMASNYDVTEGNDHSILQQAAEKSGAVSIGVDANGRCIIVQNFNTLVTYKTVADKTALQAALAAAATLTESDYTADSWAVLADAVATGNAVMADASATQGQVNAATAAINSAIAGLVPAGTNAQCPYSMSNTWLNSTSSGFVTQWPTFTDSAAQTVVGVSVATPPVGAGSGFSAVQSNDLATVESAFSGGIPAGTAVNLFNSIPRSGSGIIGMEMEITSLGSGNNTRLGLQMLGWYDASFGDGIIQQLEASIAAINNGTNTSIEYSTSSRANSGGTDDSSMFTNPGGTSTTFPIRIGLYYNQATKQIGFTDSLNGNYGYIDAMTVLTTGTGYFSQELPEITGFMMYPRVWSNGGDIEPCGATLFKHASDWTLTYPAGTVDTCGNVKV